MAYGLDKFSTSGTYNSVFRSEVFNINEKFKVTKLRIALAGQVDANTTITPKIIVDDESTTYTLNPINNTNFPTRRKAIYKNTELKNIGGTNNMFLELNWTGTTKMPVLLPIRIEIDTQDDESN